MDLAAIRKLVVAGLIDETVLVCRTGEDDWTPLASRENAVPPYDGPPRTPPPPRLPVTPPPQGHAWPSPPLKPQLRTLIPVASIVGGILSLLLVFVNPVLAFLLAIPSLVFGILALAQPARCGRGPALTGVVTASLGIFLALLLFATGGGGNQEVSAMERSLSQGLRISLDAQRRFPADTVRQSKFIAAELQKIDTRDCPPDFRVAFQQNVEAWEVAIPYFEADNPGTSFLEGFLGGLTNDYSAVGFSNYQARLAADNIDQTYRQLKITAVAYGASIPSR
jgi:hypothetical protein